MKTDQKPIKNQKPRIKNQIDNQRERERERERERAEREDGLAMSHKVHDPYLAVYMQLLQMNQTLPCNQSTPFTVNTKT